MAPSKSTGTVKKRTTKQKVIWHGSDEARNAPAGTTITKKKSDGSTYTYIKKRAANPRPQSPRAEFDEHGEQIKGNRVKGHKQGWVNPNPVTPDTRHNKNTPICGAERTGRSSSGPGICCKDAGWGTNHVGWGRCRLHGGTSPTGEMAALKQFMLEQLPTLGLLRTDIGPHEAILEEVQRTAGHVQWMHLMITYLADGLDEWETMPENSKEKTLTQMTPMGIQPSVWMNLYYQERTHLVSVCSAAVKMGCAERTVKLAEDQGKLVAMVLQQIMHSPVLNLTPQQLQEFPQEARKALATVPVIEATAKEVKAPVGVPGYIR